MKVKMKMKVFRNLFTNVQVQTLIYSNADSKALHELK